MKRTICIVLVLLLAIPVIALGQGFSFVVAESDVTLYSVPGASQGYSCDVEAGDVLCLSDETRYKGGHNWYQVERADGEYWICDRDAAVYRNVTTATAAYSTVMWTSLRSNHKYVRRVIAGQTVSVAGYDWDADDKMWLRVTVSGDTGYVMAECFDFESPEDPGISGDYVYAMLTENRMATRSGPSTKYYETGSFYSYGEDVKIYSRMYDSANGIWWVQAEAKEGSHLRRVYTGSWRFADLDIDDVPEEYFISTTFMLESCTLRYGPGNNYDAYNAILSSGDSIDIYAYEDGWVQIECEISGTRYRGWVPEDKIY